MAYQTWVRKGPYDGLHHCWPIIGVQRRLDRRGPPKIPGAWVALADETLAPGLIQAPEKYFLAGIDGTMAFEKPRATLRLDVHDPPAGVKGATVVRAFLAEDGLEVGDVPLKVARGRFIGNSPMTLGWAEPADVVVEGAHPQLHIEPITISFLPQEAPDA